MAVSSASVSPVRAVTTEKNELINNAWRINNGPPEGCCLNVNSELRERRRGGFNYQLSWLTLIIVMSCLIYCVVWRLFGKVWFVQQTDLRLTLKLVLPWQTFTYRHSSSSLNSQHDAPLYFKRRWETDRHLHPMSLNVLQLDFFSFFFCSVIYPTWRFLK